MLQRLARRTRAEALRGSCILEKQRVVDGHGELDVAEVAGAERGLHVACCTGSIVAALRPHGGIVQPVPQSIPERVHHHRIHDLLHAELADLQTRATAVH